MCSVAAAPGRPQHPTHSALQPPDLPPPPPIQTAFPMTRHRFETTIEKTNPLERTPHHGPSAHSSTCSL